MLPTILTSPTMLTLRVGVCAQTSAQDPGARSHVLPVILPMVVARFRSDHDEALEIVGNLVGNLEKVAMFDDVRPSPHFISFHFSSSNFWGRIGLEPAFFGLLKEFWNPSLPLAV
jgi:hypothetical protein